MFVLRTATIVGSSQRDVNRGNHDGAQVDPATGRPSCQGVYTRPIDAFFEIAGEFNESVKKRALYRLVKCKPGVKNRVQAVARARGHCERAPIFAADKVN
jgi:hypothetical protein